MVELIQTELESMLRKCPTCKMTCTFLEFECIWEDTKGNLRTQTYYRCLKCLSLFTLELEEFEE
jgi:hypothetical protein